jgi:hypothetical protein
LETTFSQPPTIPLNCPVKTLLVTFQIETLMVPAFQLLIRATNLRMKKLIFIAHYFPPTGGAGVQRAAKFVKYLPSFGYSPLVLTGPAGTSNRWTPEDLTLLGDVTDAALVYRYEMSNHAGGDSKDAQRRARFDAMVAMGDAMIREHSPELIFVTMSPFDDALVAAELARRHGLPWIADLRDPWALDEFQVHRSRWHRSVEMRRMARMLRSATSIIMNTPEACRRFRASFPDLASKAVVSITNGYDRDDFSTERKVMIPGKFNVVHSGYFHADFGLRQERRVLEYKVLGRTRSGVRLLPRSHFYLLQALQRWFRDAPEERSHVAVVCLGVASPSDQRLVTDMGCDDLFTFAGYTPHSECLKYVQGADLLFLPMHSVADGDRATIVPGKTYEYIGSSRPILAAVPAGDARDYLLETATAFICEPSDVTEMVKILRDQFRRWRTGAPGPVSRSEVLRQFQRDALTERLASEFSRVLDATRAERR